MGNFILGLIIGALAILCIWKWENVKGLIGKIKGLFKKDDK